MNSIMDYRPHRGDPHYGSMIPHDDIEEVVDLVDSVVIAMQELERGHSNIASMELKTAMKEFGYES